MYFAPLVKGCKMSNTSDTFDATSMPIYWFAVLNQAGDDGDFDAAAEAVRELKRLGTPRPVRTPGPDLRKEVGR